MLSSHLRLHSCFSCGPKTGHSPAEASRTGRLQFDDATIDDGRLLSKAPGSWE